MDGERREIKSIGKFQKEVCTYRGEKERGGIGFVYKSRQCGVLGVYMSNLDTGDREGYLEGIFPKGESTG